MKKPPVFKKGQLVWVQARVSKELTKQHIKGDVYPLWVIGGGKAFASGYQMKARRSGR